MSKIELRTDLFPLVLTLLPDRLEEEALERYLEAFEKHVLYRRERYVSVTDATAMQHAPNARTRQRIATWMNASVDIGRQYNLGFALATSSILVRGAMTAVNWISPSAVPSTYEPDLPSALRWAIAKLHENGTPVHEGILRYQRSLTTAVSGG